MPWELKSVAQVGGSLLSNSELLVSGWEPFAVDHNVVWFRRQREVKPVEAKVITDTDRLDWLAEKRETLYHVGGSDGGWVIADSAGSIRPRFSDPRTAIDKAMS